MRAGPHTQQTRRLGVNSISPNSSYTPEIHQVQLATVHLCATESPSLRSAVRCSPPRERRSALTSRYDNGHPFVEARRRASLPQGPSGEGNQPALSSLPSSWSLSSLSSALRRGPRVLWDPSFSSLALPLSHRGILPRSHSLVQCIPLCSNYEKECSFATRRGTHNGQRTTRNYYRPTDSLLLCKSMQATLLLPIPRAPLSPSLTTPPNF